MSDCSKAVYLLRLPKRILPLKELGWVKGGRRYIYTGLMTVADDRRG
jgi:hypothetical protein